MNREIKFRGKRLDNGEWVYGSFVDWCAGPEIIVHFDLDEVGCEDFCDYKVDPKTVGQYTGVTDKDKNKIFEGDLYRSDSGYIFEVVYLESEACFVGVPVKEPESWFFLEDVLDMKKVGNKWDNPELLEVLGDE